MRSGSAMLGSKTEGVETRLQLTSLRGILVGLVLLFLVCFGLSWYLVANITSYGERIQRQSMIALASASAATLDAELLKSLKGRIEDKNSAAFSNVRKRLQRIRAAIQDCRFAYVTSARKSDVVFLADAEPTDSPDYSPPGQVYDEASDIHRSVFLTKEPAVDGPYTDRWGTWVSGLAPIVDPESGKVVAVLGFDISAKDWEAMIGRFRWAALTISGLVTVAVMLLGLFGLMQYQRATERKKAALKLVTAKKKAEAASEAKSKFLATISHEVRTPLNGVIGILGMLKDTGLTEEQERLLKTGRQSSQSLLGLINDILDFSKLEAGKLSLQTGSFSTEEIIKSVYSIIGPRAQSKGLEVSYNIDPEVPPVLIGDPDRLGQVLMNLAWNAVKFTLSGFVKLNLELADTSQDPPVYRFSVVDSGGGIPKDKQEDVFSEFETLDAGYSRKFGGTGLGLAICKALVTAMGGRIGVHSEEGIGSTFWFEVAMETGQSRLVPTEENDDHLPVTSAIAGTHILVAEDVATNQLIVADMLERMGCTVDVVSDGTEAVRSLDQRSYDAILMDVSMPEMDGVEATKIVRARDDEHAATPIIGVTAYAFDEDREKLLAAGMNDVVSKPISRSTLYQSLCRQIVPSQAASVEGVGPAHGGNNSAVG